MQKILKNPHDNNEDAGCGFIAFMAFLTLIFVMVSIVTKCKI